LLKKFPSEPSRADLKAQGTEDYTWIGARRQNGCDGMCRRVTPLQRSTGCAFLPAEHEKGGFCLLVV
jgi:hypothetical protein